MQDYEKMGLFYLGREVDPDSGQQTGQPLLYRSRHLTTHAAVIGMTGSGKTGLGISLMEEAALDQIPVIAIDPKGDLSNLALTFPRLTGTELLPWVNREEAAAQELSPEAYAEKQAALWSEQIQAWDQSPDRIRRLKDAAEVRIYTPGGAAGIPISLLRDFSAPPPAVLADEEALREKLLATATGLLTLVGWSGDPLTDREHILISGILESAWRRGCGLSLAELIGAVQSPPMQQIGVLDLESFYPSKERFGLAMRLNSLLASSGFKCWMEGEPLQIDRFLYNEAGKPRISVFSISHLSDGERMFFVTMLLNEVIAWMRSQPGTGSLRALLYMDELFGYLPPVANPPSKAPLLTLLKQARAYGLGLVLSTQNPVDLDYKALSNMGTWFIGRLQTQQDQDRVLSGLEGASSEGFDRGRVARLLSGLGKRNFYLHTVHEEHPLIFTTRFTLSYLAGPLTREQLALLSAAGTPGLPAGSPAAPGTGATGIAGMEAAVSGVFPPGAGSAGRVSGLPPVLDPGIRQVYCPSGPPGTEASALPDASAAGGPPLVPPYASGHGRNPLQQRKVWDHRIGEGIPDGNAARRTRAGRLEQSHCDRAGAGRIGFPAHGGSRVPPASPGGFPD